eukprot:Opistho-2@46453
MVGASVSPVLDMVGFEAAEAALPTMATGRDAEDNSSARIDYSRDRFPYCVVWTPLPLISWLLPFIGHVGIATSAGVIHDFAGPYTISVDRMAFGRPTKYWQLEAAKGGGAQNWDGGVKRGCADYSRRMHNLFLDNCHSHVAACLNGMGYDNTHWNAWKIGIYLILFGRYIGFRGFLRTNLPFLIIAAIAATVFLYA